MGLGSTSVAPKQSMVVYTCNPSSWEALAGETEVQGHSQLPTKYEASLECIKPCLKRQYEERVGMRDLRLDRMRNHKGRHGHDRKSLLPLSFGRQSYYPGAQIGLEGRCLVAECHLGLSFDHNPQTYRHTYIKRSKFKQIHIVFTCN